MNTVIPSEALARRGSAQTLLELHGGEETAESRKDFSADEASDYSFIY